MGKTEIDTHIAYKLTDIIVKFKDRIVLDIPEISIEHGRIYALLGPNGSGKTTLLKILALLIAPAAGNVEFMGQKVVYKEKFLTNLRKRVVLVDQSPVMFQGSVLKNIIFGPKMRKLSKKECHTRAYKALDAVGLCDLAKRRARTLSGGQIRRVAIARALACEPDILLLDEPFSDLDRSSRDSLSELIGLLPQMAKTTIIFSTHTSRETQKIKAAKIMLENGKVAPGSEHGPWSHSPAYLDAKKKNSPHIPQNSI